MAVVISDILLFTVDNMWLSLFTLKANRIRIEILLTNQLLSVVLQLEIMYLL